MQQALYLPGMSVQPDNHYQLISALFIRLLGVIYLIAFVSISTQIEGLAGSQGILPIAEKLAWLNAEGGVTRWFQVPTLFWLNASDAALSGVAIAGIVVSLFIVAGRLTRPALVTAFVFYLSLYHAGALFMNFQWDGLLLEAGFLAIFLTPRSRVVILLFRWLLFRLRFSSGLSKLTSQDPTWANLTALDYYFEVQPLPTPLAWWAHQLPEWLLRSGTLGTLVVELIVPFMMFLPRRWRFTAAWITIFWQILIILTSNHNWINFLTIILCLFLFDDRALRSTLPTRFLAALRPPSVDEPARFQTLRQAMVAVLASLILFASGTHFRELATMQPVTGVMGTMLDYAENWRVVNSYHVFPTMNTQRIELEISGSMDGVNWKTYQFRYKPGELTTRPKLVLPLQPRLDWQMWFVTLSPRFMPLFHSFLERLLQGSTAVTALLADNPFADEPPRYIRVQAWRYRFSSPELRDQTGQWWQREPLGAFTPLPILEKSGFSADDS